MNKAFFTGFVLLVLVAFISCQKEIDINLGGTNNNGGGGSGGGGNNNNSDCKACAYLPYCDNSTYSYYDTLLGIAPVVSSDVLKFIKDTVFSGKTFHKFTASSTPTPVYTNCTSGITTTAIFDVGVTGGTLSQVVIRPLQENLAVNGTWNDTLVNGLGQPVIYKYTVKQKGISRTVSGKTFNDVIYVQVETGVEVAGFGFFVTNMSDYYYAKMVGLIEALITNEDGTLVYQHRVIKSYNIP